MMSGVSPDSILELFCGFTERYLVLSDEFTSIACASKFIYPYCKFLLWTFASFAGLELGDCGVWSIVSMLTLALVNGLSQQRQRNRGFWSFAATYLR
jgi:hypothetical protein